MNELVSKLKKLSDRNFLDYKKNSIKVSGLNKICYSTTTSSTKSQALPPSNI